MIYPPLSCSDLIFHHTFGKPLANTTFMQHVFSTGSVGLWLLHEAWDLFLEMVRGLVSAVSAIRSPVNRAVRFYNPWALWIASELEVHIFIFPYFSPRLDQTNLPGRFLDLWAQTKMFHMVLCLGLTR